MLMRASFCMRVGCMIGRFGRILVAGMVAVVVRYCIELTGALWFCS
jgi:hypothetical protein